MSSSRNILVASLLTCCAAAGNNGPAIAQEKKQAEQADDAKSKLNKALNKAASLGQVATVKDLLKKGADIQWRDASDHGKTPLVRAILGERFEVVKVLLNNGADIHYPDGSGRYPVFFCCLSKNVEMVKYVLGKGGDQDINRGPFNILVSLCDHGMGSSELIPILIDAGASPDAFQGNVTPLIAAIQLNPAVRTPEIARAYVKALIDNKADVNLKDKTGKTPFDWAKQRGDQEIIDMLEKARAAPNAADQPAQVRAQPPDPSTEGRAQIRRLNRVEYNNTLCDLLGIEVDLKPLFPEDDVVAGFDNVGSGLQITRIHQEHYLEAAEAALNAALIHGPRPKTTTVRLTYKKDGHPPRRVVQDDTVAFFTSFPAELPQFRPSTEGLYRIRISTYAYQNEGRPLVMHVSAGNAPIFHEKYFSVAADTPDMIEFEGRMAPGSAIRIDPYGFGLIHIKPQDLASYPGPGLAIEWVEVQGPKWNTWPPESYQRLLGPLDLKKATLADAEQVLRAFIPRAFRRPVPKEKVQKYIDFLRAKISSEPSVEDALRQSLMAVLCAPDFLLLYEPPGRLDDFALASRLSYFLWRTMPDQQLIDLASRQKLRFPDELQRQVERMLQDPKAAALPEHFLGQWLRLRQIDATDPDKALYPEFDNYLKYSMLQEPRLFFEELLKHDLSLLSLIDCDFTILNQRLARHYGIAAVQGPEFRKVPLPPGCHRGGVLTMAAVLKVTANGTVTSPVLRGAWVLNNILGQPLQLPSDLMIPAVEPDIRGAHNIRTQLAKHRTEARCASCHEMIDPPGFALENFDPIGGYRTHYRALGKAPTVKLKIYDRPVQYSYGAPVVAGDVMPDGKKFKDSDQFKKILREDPEAIARNVTEKLLVYATGSPIGPADRPAVDAIVQRAREKNYGLRSLIHELVQSELFLEK